MCVIVRLKLCYIYCKLLHYIIKILPGIQTHRKVPGSSKQEPSFWQGWDSHSFILVSHLGPVKPWEQLQAKLPGVLTQIPSCSQGNPGTAIEKYI